MAKKKATTKQQGKAAIKPAKPKAHGVPPKKTGNGRKWATSDGIDDDDDPSSGDKPKEPCVRSRKKPKKATEIEEVVEAEAGVEEITDKDDDMGGNETDNETDKDKVTLQCSKYNNAYTAIIGSE
jgi:hypothetical protein